MQRKREHNMKWVANTVNTYRIFFTCAPSSPPCVEHNNFFNIQNWGAPWTYLWMGLLFCVSHTHSFCCSLVASCFMLDPTFCPSFALFFAPVCPPPFSYEFCALFLSSSLLWGEAGLQMAWKEESGEKMFTKIRKVFRKKHGFPTGRLMPEAFWILDVLQ